MVRPNESSTLKCICDSDQNRCDSKKLNYCTTNKTCFTALIRESEFHESLLTFGCLGAFQPSQFSCHVGSRTHVAIQCCNSADFCNKNLSPQFANLRAGGPVETSESNNDTPRNTMFGLIALFIILAFAVLLAWTFRRKRQNCFRLKDVENKIKKPAWTTANFPLSDFSQSGSGSGAPLLSQRTIARSINLIEVIGKGRYGQVWKGCYQGETVAVKMFGSHAESSWRRECFIYTTVMLRHDNVLSFIAADTISRLDSTTQLWIVTKYHKNGSLFDFLNHRPISVKEAISLLSSAASGLAHLHQQILGSQGKPAIAHRDVKSRNLLITNDLECCVADLGLAFVDVTPSCLQIPANCSQHPTNCLLLRTHQPVVNLSNQSDSLRSRFASPSPSSSHVTALTSCDGVTKIDSCNRREGTRRYMSPEVINGSIDCSNFDAFKRSDVYSFGLVIWETLNMVTQCDMGSVDPIQNVVTQCKCTVDPIQNVVAQCKCTVDPIQNVATQCMCSVDRTINLVTQCKCSVEQTQNVVTQCKCPVDPTLYTVAPCKRSNDQGNISHSVVVDKNFNNADKPLQTINLNVRSDKNVDVISQSMETQNFNLDDVVNDYNSKIINYNNDASNPTIKKKKVPTATLR